MTCDCLASGGGSSFRGAGTLTYTMLILSLSMGISPEMYKDLLQSMLNDFSRNYKVREDGMD